MVKILSTSSGSASMDTADEDEDVAVNEGDQDDKEG